jgi:hypothetical protein
LPGFVRLRAVSINATTDRNKKLDGKLIRHFMIARERGWSPIPLRVLTQRTPVLRSDKETISSLRLFP